MKEERLLHFLVSLDIEKAQTLVILTINSASGLGSFHAPAAPPHLTATRFYQSRTMAGCCSSHLLSPPSLPNFSPQTVARSHSQHAGDSSSTRLTGLDIKSLCSPYQCLDIWKRVIQGFLERSFAVGNSTGVVESSAGPEWPF